MKHFMVFALCCLALASSQIVPTIWYDPITGIQYYQPIQQIQPIQPQQPNRPVTQQRFDANPGEFPYQVAIEVDGHAHCGGTLISKKHVLTAAHCTHDWIQKKKDKSTIKVIVGTNNLDNGGTVMSVARVSQHPSFRWYGPDVPILSHDIAVIRLTKEITESKFVKPIKLPAAYQEIPDNTRLILTGFGAAHSNGPPSRLLRFLHLYVLDHYTCSINWSNRGQITTDHLCTTLAPGFGACNGDSGGPLVLEDKSTVVGVVSEGIGLGHDCGSGWPDLFTKVSHHMEFINSELAITE